MEGIQRVLLALVCEREVSFIVANFRFQFRQFALSKARTDFLIFLAITGLLAETNYIRFLYYQLAIH